MRNGQNNNKRMRGRNRRGHNPMTRVYESNGPDVKIRGTAHHIAEKYTQLARDAQSSGDPVAAEGYLQHAEHYYRMIMAAQAQFAQQNPHHQQQPFQRPDMDGRDEFDDEGDDTGGGDQPQQQPNFQGGQQQPNQQNQQMQRPQQQPQPQHQPQPNFQGYQPRRDQDEQRDAGLPAFITGGGAPQGQMNGGDNEQGDRMNDRGDRNDRFGRRRRRFRPRGPHDHEGRGENGGEMQGGASGNDAQPAGDFAPKSGE
jgi:hypothetical protein